MAGSVAEFLERLERLPMVGIVRGVESSALPTLANACLESGLELLEITMNTARAAEKNRRLRPLLGDRAMLGAGTVLSLEELEAALDAGARFIVSPVLVPEVVAACVARGVPVLPGALTPQEVFAASRAGATVVKVFPAGCFGPDYLRELLAPLAPLRLLPTGGVRADNVDAYFRAGAVGVGVGGSVFDPGLLAAGEERAVAERIAELVQAVRRARLVRD